MEQGKVRLERKIPRRDLIRGWDTSLMRRMAMHPPFLALCSVQAVSLAIMLCLFTTTNLSPISIPGVDIRKAMDYYSILWPCSSSACRSWLFVSCQELFFRYHCAVHLPSVRTNAQVSFPHFAAFFTCLKAFVYEGRFLEKPRVILSAFALPDGSDNMDPLSLSSAAFLASVTSLPGAPGSLWVGRLHPCCPEEIQNISHDTRAFDSLLYSLDISLKDPNIAAVVAEDDALLL